MCGIAGYLRRDGAPASAGLARAMADAMAHRGPDGRGAFVDGEVALGHARLAVRDRGERAAQPMLAADGAGALVYNGEVYNDRELRDALAREGVAVASHGDAEVVLRAISRFGVLDAARRLDGMFAFAWWDARERALWLVRDRFGTKPLHVAVRDDMVAFASEVRGLRALLGSAPRPNVLDLARRALPPPVDERRPPFEGVENVEPGEAWRVTTKGIERRTWFDLLDEVDPARILANAREPGSTWEARVEETLTRAVEEHLASDVPLAAFTSGGVDSNLVAALAYEHRRDLVAYTVDTKSGESEVEAAKEVARHVGFSLRVVEVGRDAYLSAWPASVEALEHPPSHPSHPAAFLLARAARADGIVVALTGEGADELFGGYEFFERTRHGWREAESPLRRLSHAGRARRRDLEDVPLRYQSVRRERDTHLRVASALLPVEETRARELMRRLEPIRPTHDRAFLAHSLDALRRHLGWILLRHDRVGMAASLESRVPFLSNRVADLALHLPVREKIRGRDGKHVLKRVAAKRLPPSRVFARKQGFPIPASHHRGTSALLAGGVVPDVFGWTRRAQEDLLPRIEANGAARMQFVGLEIWGRLLLRGERPDAVAERLLALPAPT